MLGWRGDAAADALGDERACCLHAGSGLGVVAWVGVEHHRHLFLFASVKAGRRGSGLVRRTANQAVVVAEVTAGVVGRAEEFSLSERRIDLGGGRRPEPLAVVDLDQEEASGLSCAHAPSPFSHLAGPARYTTTRGRPSQLRRRV